MQPVGDGGGDTGLVRAVERNGRSGRPGGLRPVRGAQRQRRTTGRRGAEREPAPPQPITDRRDGARDSSPEPAPEPGAAPASEAELPGWVSSFMGTRYFTTAAASFDSGSASAFTASDRSLRSAVPTLSYEVKT